MWFSILKKPILSEKEIPKGSDTRYSLAGNMASQMKNSAGIVWESEDEEARGYAFEYGDEWLITVFEVLDRGKGKGQPYLQEFVKDMKASKNYPVWAVTVIDESKPFWKKMVDSNIIYGYTQHHFPEDDELNYT